jgi:hypothetical protein
MRFQTARFYFFGGPPRLQPKSESDGLDRMAPKSWVSCDIKAEFPISPVADDLVLRRSPKSRFGCSTTLLTYSPNMITSPHSERANRL